MKKQAKKGFTIVELVIVIALIAILAAVLIPTFSNVINNAHESNDTIMVKNLNTILNAEEVKGNRAETMQEALDQAEEGGYKVEKLTPSSTGDILWDQKSNRFLLVNKKGEVVFRDESVTDEPDFTNKAYLYWKITKNAAKEEKGYSLYLDKEYKNLPETMTVTAGLDVGEHTGVAAITYRSSAAQDVIIRTNGGTLTVNAPSDKVRHYGYAEVLDVQAIASASYHEYGTSGFARLVKGHFVVESKGIVNVLYATGTKSGETAVIVDNNNGIIGKAYATQNETANLLNNVEQEGQTGNVVLEKYDAVITESVITAMNSTSIVEELNKTETSTVKETIETAVENSSFRGEGTESSPYLISNANELKLYQEKVNKGLYCSSSDYFKLTNDIDISAYNWSSIGVETTDTSKQYNGHFDGNNKTIYGLTINSESGVKIGLFGIVYGPTIENVRLSNANINGLKRIGGLVGEIEGNATIRNCTIDAESTIIGSDANVGGLIGEAIKGTNITLSHLTNNANIVANGASDGRAAGIIGQVTTKAVVTITNCINNGKISAKYAGGIISAFQGGNVTVINCTNEKDLSDFTGSSKANICAWMCEDVSISITAESNHDFTKDLCKVKINMGSITLNEQIYILPNYIEYNWQEATAAELSKDKLDFMLKFFQWVNQHNYIANRDYENASYSYFLKHFTSVAAVWNRTTASQNISYEDAEKTYCEEKGITYSEELFQKTWDNDTLYKLV